MIIKRGLSKSVPRVKRIMVNQGCQTADPLPFFETIEIALDSHAVVSFHETNIGILHEFVDSLKVDGVLGLQVFIAQRKKSFRNGIFVDYVETAHKANKFEISEKETLAWKSLRVDSFFENSPCDHQESRSNNFVSGWPADRGLQAELPKTR